jgi:serine-type D-Ala-D-Ala carboxypeptidase/endopeptidase (penicillin-binding protein 4)
VGGGDRRNASVRWLPVVLVLALLAGAGAAYRFDLGERWFGTAPDPTTEPAAVPPPEGVTVPPLAVPRPVAAPEDGGVLVASRVRRSLAAGLRDPDLGRSVHAMVAPLEGDSGPVFSVGDGSFLPASTTKLLTGAAVLAALGPDHRFATTVVARGRELTLVGGGDPLLARSPQPTDWPARADVRTLARAAAQGLSSRQRRRGVRLRYDAFLFEGPSASRHWRADYVPDDIVSPIRALWVDEGREAGGAGPEDDPAAEAAAAFASALREAGVRVKGAPRPGAAPGAGEEVARVESAPLSQLVEWMLLVSDNEAAEVLAHHVGLDVLGDGSFAGGARAVRQTLAGLGVPMAGAVIHDGSGLSRRNRLRPSTLLEVLRLAARDDLPDLRPVLTGLPVAAFTGSLATRFDEAPVAGVGRVRAKTGTLTGVSALAGTATDLSGTPLVFVLAADRVRVADTLDARQALDNLAGALGACRCSR